MKQKLKQKQKSPPVPKLKYVKVYACNRAGGPALSRITRHRTFPEVARRLDEIQPQMLHHYGVYQEYLICLEFVFSDDYFFEMWLMADKRRFIRTDPDTWQATLTDMSENKPFLHERLKAIR